jgi:histidinol-phosphatase (PHP family)
LTGIHGDPWKVSLHGGHSGAYCDHATGTLSETLEAAVEFGYHIFGVSEHAPRHGIHLLYNEEVEMGWDVEKIIQGFEDYAVEAARLAKEFDGRLTVLRGFEAEVAPSDEYAELMLDYRERFAFDYMVGSIHFVDDVSIDGPTDDFELAEGMQGGLEELGIRYYEQVAEMVRALNPEVVGHMDLIRKNAPSQDTMQTPAIRYAALQALETIRDHGCILDLNTAGYRKEGYSKGLGVPYPAPWLVQKARDMGIGFCFGDDSHAPNEVGAGIEEARSYLQENGVSELTILTREEGVVVKKTVPLRGV